MNQWRLGRLIGLLWVLAVAGCRCGEPPLPEHPVEVTFDTLGIPHIRAQTDRDAIFAAGYMMAHDRLFQMELMRRRALGTMSEVLGAHRLRDDQASRMVHFEALGRADMERIEREHPEVAALGLAWVAGVNRRLEEVRSGAAPRPYGLGKAELDFVPEPWEPHHPYMVGKMLAFGLSSSFEQEMLGTIAQTLAPEFARKVPIIMPAFDVPLVPTARAAPSPMTPTPPPGAPPFDPARIALSGKLPAHFKSTASNNWAVAGRFTDNGRPYVAGDPHQDVTSPNRFWLSHVNSADAGGTLDVTGFSFVGTPMIQLGHNAKVAWTATVAFADVMDFYDVEVEPDYSEAWLGGEAKPIVSRREIIRIRRDDGSVDESELWIHDVPGWGVLVPDVILPVPKFLLSGRELLFSWTGFRPTTEAAAYLAMNRAGNLDAFEDAARLLLAGPINLIAADAQGITYLMHAAIPDRGPPGERPVPWRVMNADDPKTLWTRGDLPASYLPRDRDPERGFLHSANADPFGFTSNGSTDDDPFYYGGFFGNGIRQHRLEEVLTELTTSGRKITREDMEEMQRDVTSVMAGVILPHLEAAMEALDTDPALEPWKERADLRELAGRLLEWDGRFTLDQQAPAIFLPMEWFAIRRLFLAPVGELLFDVIAEGAPVFLEGLLRNVLDARFAGADELLPPGGRPALLFAALDDTATWLARHFGSATEGDYSYADIHGTRFASEFGGEANRPWVPVPGSTDTLNVSEAPFFLAGHAPQKAVASPMAIYRMVTGFAEDGRPESTFNFMLGNHEDPDHPRFELNQPDWLAVDYQPLPFRPGEIEAKRAEVLVIPAAQR